VPTTRFCLYTILAFTVFVPLGAGYLYSLLTHHNLQLSIVRISVPEQLICSEFCAFYKNDKGEECCDRGNSRCLPKSLCKDTYIVSEESWIVWRLSFIFFWASKPS
jgi:hypothetical protein